MSFSKLINEHDNGKQRPNVITDADDDTFLFES